LNSVKKVISLLKVACKAVMLHCPSLSSALFSRTLECNYVDTIFAVTRSDIISIVLILIQDLQMTWVQFLKTYQYLIAYNLGYKLEV